MLGMLGKSAPNIASELSRREGHTFPCEKIMAIMVEEDFEDLLYSPTAHTCAASLPRRLRGEGIEGKGAADLKTPDSFLFQIFRISGSDSIVFSGLYPY